jgi:hypothetical protein
VHVHQKATRQGVSDKNLWQATQRRDPGLAAMTSVKRGRTRQCGSELSERYIPHPWKAESVVGGTAS